MKCSNDFICSPCFIDNTMIERNAISEPDYILKGQNYLRVSFFILLTILLLTAIVSVFYVGAFMMAVVLGALAGLFSIRFPSILIYNDRFFVKKTSVLSILSSYEEYRFEYITDLIYTPEKNDWLALILLSLSGKGAYGTFGEPDRILVHISNGNKKVIFRIGSRKRFKEAFDYIQSKIRSN